jgi:hypothetical protein
LQWVGEKLLVVIDSGEPGSGQKFIGAQNFVPDLIDRGDLGKEPVSAYIKQVSLVIRGSRNPPHDVVLL